MLLQLKQINEIKNEALLKWNTKQIQLLEDLDNVSEIIPSNFVESTIGKRLQTNW